MVISTVSGDKEIAKIMKMDMERGKILKDMQMLIDNVLAQSLSDEKIKAKRKMQTSVFGSGYDYIIDEDTLKIESTSIEKLLKNIKLLKKKNKEYTKALKKHNKVEF